MPAAGDRIQALDFPATQSDTEDTDQTNITTTAAAGSPTCDVTFTAPTSGKVLVHVGGVGQDNGANNSVIIEPEVREDDAAGAIVAATGTESRQLILRCNTSTTPASGTRTSLVSGLTAGSTYYAQTMHFSDAGTTADVLSRSIIVQPLAT